jgi:hypothetical protein
MVAELIEGALHLHPRPAVRHARANSALGMRVGAEFDAGESGPSGWRILDEGELQLGSDVLVPDLAGWRRERLPALPDAARIELAPDWISPTSAGSTPRRRRASLARRPARPHVGGAFALRDGAWTLGAALGDDEDVRVGVRRRRLPALGPLAELRAPRSLPRRQTHAAAPRTGLTTPAVVSTTLSVSGFTISVGHVTSVARAQPREP